MNNVVDDKLTPPEVNYGAVYGRDQKGQNKRYFWLGVYTLVWLSAVAVAVVSLVNPNFFPEGLEQAGIAFAWLLGIAGVLIVAPFLVDYNKELFLSDRVTARDKYAKTVFKEWFEKRYGVKIDPSDALSLMNGNRAYVTKYINGRHESVKVEFDYNQGFKRFSSVGSLRFSIDSFEKDDWKYFPNLDEVDFRLMIIEEPAKPRRYEW